MGYQLFSLTMGHFDIYFSNRSTLDLSVQLTTGAIKIYFVSVSKKHPVCGRGTPSVIDILHKKKKLVRNFFGAKKFGSKKNLVGNFFGLIFFGMNHVFVYFDILKTLSTGHLNPMLTKMAHCQ